MESANGASFPVVVIGGSAGALEPLQLIVSTLPPDLNAAVLVVIHVPASSLSSLPNILSRSGQLFAAHGIDRAPLSPGQIFVARPNRHLTVDDGVMRVLQGPRENGHRPSIDVLFRSAASQRGPSACGVLLSGALDDGVAGLLAIREAGGMTIVQSPDDATFSDMPENAVNGGAADAILPASEIGAAISDFVEQAAEPALSEPRDERVEGKASVFTCPDCGGTLWEAEIDGALRYRCRTGHAFSERSLLSEQSDGLEAALWASLRSLEERSDLLRRVSKRARGRGDKRTADRLSRQAEETDSNFEMLRRALFTLTKEEPA